MVLLIGALLGFVSVAFGAYAAHGLQVPEDALRSVMTAVRYNQVHAVVVTAIGLALASRCPARAALAGAAWLFIAGTILFSFSIYLSEGAGLSFVGGAAPVGGIVLMAGWLGLAWTGLRIASGREG